MKPVGSSSSPPSRSGSGSPEAPSSSPERRSPSSDSGARPSTLPATRESPFHIKGSAYLLHLQFVQEVVPGGMTAFVEALGTPHLRAFFAQPFFITSWYDLLPLIEAGRACAPLMGTTFEQFVRLRSRHQFRGDLHTFRKLILRLASPSLLASKIPKTVATYLDFTECVNVVQEGNRVTGLLRAVPRPTAEWIQFVFEEFVHEALEVNGAKDATMRWKATLSSPRHGVLCDDWSYVIAWA